MRSAVFRRNAGSEPDWLTPVELRRNTVTLQRKREACRTACSLKSIQRFPTVPVQRRRVDDCKCTSRSDVLRARHDRAVGARRSSCRPSAERSCFRAPFSRWRAGYRPVAECRKAAFTELMSPRTTARSGYARAAGRRAYSAVDAGRGMGPRSPGQQPHVGSGNGLNWPSAPTRTETSPSGEGSRQRSSRGR
jgi:hypothetical protein